MKKLLTAALLALASPAAAYEPARIVWSHMTNGSPDWYSSKAPAIAYYGGAYASLFRINNQSIIYSNETLTSAFTCPGPSCPGLMRYTGVGDKWDQMQYPPQLVAPNSIINDVFDTTGALHPQRMISRPHVVRVSATEWYATVYVTQGYPPADGNVVPAFMSSPDGINWTYHGKFGAEVAGWLGAHSSWGSSLAYRARSGTYALNHTQPMNNKHFMIADALFGKNLVALYSANGRDWYAAKNADGSVRDVLPQELRTYSQGKIFASMVWVPLRKGFVMTATDKWPPTNIIVSYSCDGLNWRVQGNPAVKSPLIPPFGTKNASLGPYISGAKFSIMVTDVAKQDLLVLPPLRQHNTERVFFGTVPESMQCP